MHIVPRIIPRPLAKIAIIKQVSVNTYWYIIIMYRFHSLSMQSTLLSEGDPTESIIIRVTKVIEMHYYILEVLLPQNGTKDVYML